MNCSDQEYDVVIPCHPKDFASVDVCVAQIRSYLAAARNVYVVSSIAPPTLPNAIWLSDAVPTFSRDRLAESWRSRCTRRTADRFGWIYQQILKLSADLYIPELTRSFLCIDADVFVLRPVGFLEPDQPPFLYVRAAQYHLPYLNTYRRLMAEEARAGFSFIADHMMFERESLGELRRHIERVHQTTWWAAIFDALDYNERSSFSEFDLYGNWMLSRYPSCAAYRPLTWGCIDHLPSPDELVRLAGRFDFVSAHAHLRTPSAR